MVGKYPALAYKAIFLDLLDAGSSPTSVTSKAQLDAWVKKFAVPYSVLKDPDGVTTFDIKTKISDRKTMFVIELSTMKILQRSYDVHTSTWDFLATL